MGMDSEFISVGSALILQDAEYLRDLIAAHEIPCQLAEDHDQELAAQGRTTVVKVKRMHLQWALEIRANEFAEPGDESSAPVETLEETAKRRPVLRTLVLGFAGVMMGMRIGVRLRGGAWSPIVAGGVMGLLAMLASMLYGGGGAAKPEPNQLNESVDGKRRG